VTPAALAEEEGEEEAEEDEQAQERKEEGDEKEPVAAPVDIGACNPPQRQAPPGLQADGSGEADAAGGPAAAGAELADGALEGAFPKWPPGKAEGLEGAPAGWMDPQCADLKLVCTAVSGGQPPPPSNLIAGTWQDSLGNTIWVPLAHMPHIEPVAWLFGPKGSKGLPFSLDKWRRLWCGNGLLHQVGYAGAAGSPFGQELPTHLAWRTTQWRISVWVRVGPPPPPMFEPPTQQQPQQPQQQYGRQANQEFKGKGKAKAPEAEMKGRGKATAHEGHRGGG
jgi:hypothetical protein